MESIIAGYKNREEAIINIVQTLNNLLTKWPRETFSGFMVHFSNRNLDALSEFSSIDSTIAVLGALFAGNYFGGEVSLLLYSNTFYSFSIWFWIWQYNLEMQLNGVMPSRLLIILEYILWLIQILGNSVVQLGNNL